MNKLLSVCLHSAQQRHTPAAWTNGMLVSTETFLKCVSNVTGRDLRPFIDQWVRQPGHAEFSVSLNFNRKRNSIELDVKQNVTARGAVRFTGPVTGICNTYYVYISYLYRPGLSPEPVAAPTRYILYCSTHTYYIKILFLDYYNRFRWLIPAPVSDRFL